MNQRHVAKATEILESCLLSRMFGVVKDLYRHCNKPEGVTLHHLLQTNIFIFIYFYLKIKAESEVHTKPTTKKRRFFK